MSALTKDTAKPPRIGKPKATPEQPAKSVTAAKTKMVSKINLNEESVDKADTPVSPTMSKPSVPVKQTQPEQTGEPVMTSAGIDIFSTINNRKPDLPDQPLVVPFVEELKKLHKL